MRPLPLLNGLFLAALACALFPLFPAAAASDIEKLDSNFAAKDATGEWLWYDARGLTVEGKGWQDTARFYDRLPARAEGAVPKSVWSLSRHSAGLCVRFTTDAPKISARWTVLNPELAMPHMPATGVSGLDLYVRDGAVWRWIGNGRPKEQTTEALLADGIPEGLHEFMVCLPLYNGTESLEIGVPPAASLAKGAARPADREKPVLFYGTSITHGGCASRPGMAYPAILGRRLDRPVINLGFSGSGRMEPALGELVAEVEAAVYVLDCLPNLTPQEVTERVEPFVKALRAARPGTPIVLVENISYQAGTFLPGPREAYTAKNDALRAAHERLTAAGVTGLTYVPGAALLGDDGEATVDGTHPTDLGFQRMADALEPVLRGVLSGERGAGDAAAREAFLREFPRTGLSTTPEDALLLRILVETRNAQRGVEVGSFTGYGALHMGIAFERTGGHLYTLEIDPEAVKTCRENLAKTGLDKSVTCVEGDALKTLPELEGVFDFAYIDAVKTDYFKYFQLIEPKLKPGAVIVADNVIVSADAMRDYLDHVQKSPDYATVIVRASDEKKDGMAVTYKLR